MSAKKKSHENKARSKQTPKKRIDLVDKQRAKRGVGGRKRVTKSNTNVSSKKRKTSKRVFSEAEYKAALYEKELLTVCKKLKEPCTVEVGRDALGVNAVLWVKGNDIEKIFEELSRIQRLSKKDKPWIQVAFTGEAYKEFKNYLYDGHSTFGSYATKNFAILRAAIIDGKVFENTKKYIDIQWIRVRLHWNEDNEQPDEMI